MGNRENQAYMVKDNIISGKIVPFETKHRGVGQMLLESLMSNPDGVGQIDATNDEVYTFGEMRDRAIGCAQYLKRSGISTGDVVALCTHNQPDAFAPCVAALFVGAIFNPWDPDMNTNTARHFLTLSRPKVIFTSEKCVQVIQEAMKIENYAMPIVVFGEHQGLPSFESIIGDEKSRDVANFRSVAIDDLQQTACILYSSGTTGPPKGVQISHVAILQHLETKEGFTLSNQVPLWFSSLYWISGTFLTLQSIATLTKRILYPDFDEETTCRLIMKYKVTWLFSGTSMANRLLKSGAITKYDLSSLKVIFIGGAILKEESQRTLQRLLPNTSVLQAFGMTELGGVGTNQMPGQSKPGSCGCPSKNVQMKIVDPETKATIDLTEVGELCVKTPTMTTGYYRNPEATRNTIDSAGWLHTGDLAYFDENGELHVIDRLKELIKYRGHQVSPAEIETLLQTHSGVMEVAVVALTHPLDDEHPIAFVSRTPGRDITEKELVELVEMKLDDHYRLRGGVKFLENLPYTPSGKISRKELRSMAKKYTRA